MNDIFTGIGLTIMVVAMILYYNAWIKPLCAVMIMIGGVFLIIGKIAGEDDDE